MADTKLMDALVERVAEKFFKGTLPPFSEDIVAGVLEVVPELRHEDPELLRLFLLRLAVAFRQRIETQQSI